MEIGINAMSSIGAMREDFEGTISKLRDGGCNFIEGMSDWGAKQETIDFYSNLTGGSSGWDRDNTIARIEVMKKYGMSIKGVFVFYEELEEQAEDLGVYCKNNEISYIVISFLKYDDIDDIYGKIAMIKRVSKVVGKYGVSILLHNHEHDMLMITDKDGREKQTISIFMEQCTSAELMLEIDTGWLVYSGIDSAKYVRENLDRIAVLHLKDICKGFEYMEREDVFTPCGQGVVDFPGVIEAAKTKGSMIYVLDQDSSKGDITEDNLNSIKYIRGL